MKKLTLILCSSLSLLFSNVLVAQQKTVSGIVKSSVDNSPLAGTTITIKELNRSVTTAEDGSFSIKVTGDKAKNIELSSVGFERKEQEIGSGPVMTILMTPVANTLGEVQIVGSRNAHRTKISSPVPVDIFDVKNLKEIGAQTTLTQILQNVAPSFSSLKSSGQDAATTTSLAQLRGLSVDQVLVLVNGKRRHKSSNINFGGNGNGSTGYDLNAIPLNSIDRIEVLRDGAAAQYGSDAIAGVINIVLKRDVEKMTFSSTAGIRHRGDGIFTREGVNYGFKLGDKGGYINATAEFATRGITLPGNKDGDGLYTGVMYGGGASSRGYDAVYTKEIDEAIMASRGINRKYFDTRGTPYPQKDALIFFNAAAPLKGAEFYAFGGISNRHTENTGSYRYPGWGTRTNNFIYPDGYLPQMAMRVLDKSLAMGIKGEVNGWNVDLSNTYGANTFFIRVENSMNATMGLSSPTSFDAGGYGITQNNTGLDISRYFKNVLYGLNVAYGAQYRVENYKLNAGELNSYVKADQRQILNVDTTSGGIQYLDAAGITALNSISPGSQVYQGVNPTNAANVTRSVVAGYLDLEANITKKWLLSAAGRVENFSDFGTVSTVKVATRYSVDKWLAIRGSFSTGFRAPDLAQFYYSNLTTAFQNGRGVDILTAANNSAAARALGIPSLTPERSKSITAGLTSQVIPNLEISVDGYQVDVDNRVGLTGSFVSTDANLPTDVKNAFAATGANQALFFFNAFDTRTTGIEFTASYKIRTGNKSDLSLIAGGNFMKTEVLDVHLPAKLNESYLTTVLSPAEKNRIEKQTPNKKINFQAIYRVNKLSFMVRPVYFGEVTSASALSANNYFYQTYPAIIVTDISVGYKLNSIFRVTGGLENAFNEVGDYVNATISGFRTPSPGGLQNGATGRQYFISLNAQF